MKHHNHIARALATATLAVAAPAAADSPFMTDDPEPTEPGRLEIYGFLSRVPIGEPDEGDGGLDIDYGAAPDLQLSLDLPMARQHGVGGYSGLGDVTVGAKYRLMSQSDETGLPDVALYPAISAPTASHRLGSGRWSASLPVWLKKDLGPWRLIGGGGFTFNPGPGNRNYWSGGLAAQRQVTERLRLGVEIHHRTADEDDARPLTGMNLAVAYKITPSWSVLASGSPGPQNPRDGGRYAFFLAFEASY